MEDSNRQWLSLSIRRKEPTFYKKTCNELAYVSLPFHRLITYWFILLSSHSGTRQLSIQARIKNNEKPRSTRSEQERTMYSSQPISQVVVSMYRTSLWSSIIKCQTRSRRTFTGLVGLVVRVRLVWRSLSLVTQMRISCMSSFSCLYPDGTLTRDWMPNFRYDLKQEISKSPVSRVAPGTFMPSILLSWGLWLTESLHVWLSELARHPAAQSKMSNAMKRMAQDIED